LNGMDAGGEGTSGEEGMQAAPKEPRWRRFRNRHSIMFHGTPFVNG
jgi:hypothetical protein